MAKQSGGRFIHPDEVKVSHEPGVKRANQSESTRWWLAQPAKAFKHVIDATNTIEMEQRPSYVQLRLFEAMYGDGRSGQGIISSANRLTGAMDNTTPRLSVNVIQSCIDTLASQISSDKPKPQFVPNEGDYRLRSKAKMATDFLEGEWDRCDVYPKSQRMFTDALIYGISGLYVNSRFKKLNIEYLNRDEILVDEMDGFTEEPRQLYLKRFISREKLCRLYPKHRQQIEKIQPAKTDASRVASHSVSDLIVCIESWHLPTDEDADDGRYCMTVENGTLEFSDYQHDHFPVVFFRPYSVPRRFSGRGVVQTLFSLQVSLNRLLRTISLAQDFAVPRAFVENGSQVDVDTFNDEIGQIINYTGTMPVFESFEPMPESAYSWVQYLEQHAYQISGVSQASAAGEKPKGVESAVAMETVADIQAGRFENMSLSWNRFFMDLAHVSMFISADLYVKNPKLKTKLKRNNLIREIEWDKMDFEQERFGIQLFPINRLPHDPAGRLDVIQRYIQAGWIDEITALSLLDMPDISEETSLMTGSLHLSDKFIASMLDDGEVEHPIPQMDLGLARNRCKLAIVRAHVQNYPLDHIQLVVNFDQECADMIAAATAATAQAATAANAALPMPTPQPMPQPTAPAPQSPPTAQAAA